MRHLSWSARRGCPLLAVLIVALGTAACRSVPFGDRRQLRLVGASQEVAMGAQAYQALLEGKKIETGTERALMVERVGRRIAAVTGQDYAWEFKLVRDDATVNAFCLPGGKIAVYTGILPITRNEDGLAAVLGHEVGHALAHHGAERVSQSMLAETTLAVIEAGLGGADPGVRAPVMAALGLGTEVGIMLPYSRLHEDEADGIGLRLMVRAGYNPHEAVRLWERMAAAHPSRTPALLSTHPDPSARATRMARLIPKVLSEERRMDAAATR